MAKKMTIYHTLPELLTLKEAASILKCHPNTLRLWDKSGELRAIRIGKRQTRRYAREAIINFLVSERQQSQEVQQAFLAETQSKKQFGNILESISDAFIAIDMKWRYSYINEKAAALMNNTPSDYLGKALFQVHPNFRKSIFYRKYKEALETKKNSTFDYYYDELDKWYTVKVFPSLDGLSVYFDDITDRKKAEEKLRESEERYRNFIRLSSEGIWRVELEKPVKVTLSKKKQIELMYRYGYLAECNVAMANMYGFSSPSDLLGARLGDLLIPTDPQNTAYLTAFIESGYRLDNTESAERDRNGDLKYFVNNLTGIVEDGYILRAWGTQRDVTKVKESQQELERIRTYYKRLFESNIIGIVFAGYKGESLGSFIDANDFFLKKFGYTRSELQSGKIRWDRITPKEFAHLDQKALNELEKKGECEPYEKAYLNKQGKKVPIFLGIAAIPGTDYCIAYILDITRRKELEKIKDDFIGIASHELKTPVTSLKAFGQVLQKRFVSAGDTTSAELLMKMDTQINRLTGLISDLLDVTKMESGKIQFHESTFAFDDLVVEIVEQVQRTASSHTIIVEGKTQKTIRGDRDRIGQVITNFLTNAIKYSPDADKILIQMSVTKKEVEFSVIDYGFGIPPEKMKRVFERFYRVSSKAHDTVAGMGLGLFISKEIIERQNGRIWAESIPNKGSTFYFTLPLQ